MLKFDSIENRETKGEFNMHTKDLTKDNIDFKALSKSCKTQDDLSNLTKHFMKNMIGNLQVVNLIF